MNTKAENFQKYLTEKILLVLQQKKLPKINFTL